MHILLFFSVCLSIFFIISQVTTWSWFSYLQECFFKSLCFRLIIINDYTVLCMQILLGLHGQSKSEVLPSFSVYSFLLPTHQASEQGGMVAQRIFQDYICMHACKLLTCLVSFLLSCRKKDFFEVIRRIFYKSVYMCEKIMHVQNFILLFNFIDAIPTNHLSAWVFTYLYT